MAGKGFGKQDLVNPKQGIIASPIGCCAWEWTQPVLYVPGFGWDSWKPVFYIKLPKGGAHTLIDPVNPPIHFKSAVQVCGNVGLFVFLFKLGTNNPHIYECWVNHYTTEELGSPLYKFQEADRWHIFCMERSQTPERVIATTGTLDLTESINYLNAMAPWTMAEFTEAKENFPYSKEQLWDLL